MKLETAKATGIGPASVIAFLFSVASFKFRVVTMDIA